MTSQFMFHGRVANLSLQVYLRNPGCMWGVALDATIVCRLAYITNCFSQCRVCCLHAMRIIVIPKSTAIFTHCAAIANTQTAQPGFEFWLIAHEYKWSNPYPTGSELWLQCTILLKLGFAVSQVLEQHVWCQHFWRWPTMFGGIMFSHSNRPSTCRLYAYQRPSPLAMCWKSGLFPPAVALRLRRSLNCEESVKSKSHKALFFALTGPTCGSKRKAYDVIVCGGMNVSAFLTTQWSATTPKNCTKSTLSQLLLHHSATPHPYPADWSLT